MTGHICEVEESGNSVCVPAVSVGCIACRTSFFNYLNFFLVCISRSRSSYHVPYQAQVPGTGTGNTGNNISFKRISFYLALRLLSWYTVNRF